MTLKLIEQNHEFASPGTFSMEADIKAEIYKGQATVILRGIEPSFARDHHLLQFKARIIDIKVRERKVEYTLEFDLLDDSNYKGKANISTLVVAETYSD